MMTDVDFVLAYCQTLLKVDEFSDYAPNGLQVAGSRPISRIVTGVTACQALLDAAIADDADAVLVHHGLFWKGQDWHPVGILGRRIGTLMRAGVALLAYHLPLDAHPTLGNNVHLGQRLGAINATPTAAGNGLVWRGTLEPARSAADWIPQLTQAFDQTPLHIQAHERKLYQIAWCSGGAPGYLEAAAQLGGIDAYLSGEISEPTTHQARELGVDYFALGHHASERDGIRALGAHLAAKFNLEHQFIDIPNPA